MIFLAADYPGNKMKEEIKDYLEIKGYKIKDLGTGEENDSTYPDLAEKVAQKVVSEFNSRGILFSSTGIGMCIAANKVKKAAAAVVYNESLAEKSRTENNTNVLCLPCALINLDLAKEIVSIWLSTSFSGVDYFSDANKKIAEM